ncbi:pirin family protein [Acetobacter indonesiensis]|uniref:pirin family protein n=1 Tax=Acetobacter indonesiensis TaxID=104101 RepID=UPI0020A2A31E|nr:pirin family protein [Acetobacter indonesiensis]MCP1232161.1 pirin family protein [Acetobacter indonesiensis]
MIVIRHADSLGQMQQGDALLRCHFAFGSCQDPEHVHDGRLRAVNVVHLPANADYVLGPERNVDIVTWVANGTLTARNDLFPDETIEAGGLHLLSAASGCLSMSWRAGTAGASFLQFWFLPDEEGGEPAQEARSAFAGLEDGGFRILASGFPEDDPQETGTITDGAPVTLRASARLLHAEISQGEGACYRTTPDRTLYLVVARGGVAVDNAALGPGDGARIDGEQSFTVMATGDSVILLADTAAG